MAQRTKLFLSVGGFQELGSQTPKLSWVGVSVKMCFEIMMMMMIIIIIIIITVNFCDIRRYVSNDEA
jgi:hypothetical protein